jgi:hypothetical protein
VSTNENIFPLTLPTDISKIVSPFIPEEDWRKSSMSIEIEFSGAVVAFRLKGITSESN